MIVSDLVTGALFVVLALVHPVWALLAVASLGAVASTPFRAGSAAAIPNLVRDPALIARANGRMAMGSNLGITLGPALGGVMVGAIGAGWVFVLNAVSFVASAALVASISAPFQADRSSVPNARSERGDWLVGFRFVARDRVLWVGTLAWVVLLLGMSIGIVADRPIAEEFDVGSRGFGVMLGLYGVGAVIGAWRASRLGRATEPRALVVGFVVAGAAGLLIGSAGAFAVVVVGNFVWGIGDAITTVARSGIVQRRTPDAIRGRVSAANETIVHLALMVGFLAAGPAIDVLGPRGAYAVSGGSALVAAALTATIVAAARSTTDAEAERATVPT
jgi:predicted MFS family arabinose efflux permease